MPAVAETRLERDFRRQQAALDSGWVFGIAHDGGCSIHAIARSAGGETASVSVGWTVDDGFSLMLSTRILSPIEAPVIEVVGAPRSYSFPMTGLPEITGHDAMELKQDISAGRALRMTGRIRGKPGRFEVPVGRGAMSIAALDACAETFKAHPVPSTPESGNSHMVHAHVLESSCRLSGFWPESGGFWIVIEAARDKAAVQLHRMASKPAVAAPGNVDLRGLGGDVMKFEEEGEIPFPVERIAPLEAAFLAGDTRSIRIETPGQSAQVLEFGGPRARAPAAMFSVCRSMLVGTPSAP